MNRPKMLVVAGVLAGFEMTAAHAVPTYTSTVFAAPPAGGASAPDSITVGAGSVWVSYAGGTTADGSEPSGNSTVVRYSPAGAVQNTYVIKGSVDGLKFNPATGVVWALQNQDANSRLSFIDPATNAVTPQPYAVTSATQGYDDVAFTSRGTFLSQTNPASAAEITLQKVVDGTSPIQVTNVLAAGAPGKNIVTGQANFVLPTFDPDSLKVAPNGDLVQTSGNRDTLVFISSPGEATQSVSYLPLTASGAAVSGLDDSLYVTASSGTLYLTETSGNQVLALNLQGLTPGTLLANIGSLSELAFVDPATGNLTPFVTGLPGAHGLAFAASAAAVPEPASLALLAAGVAGMLGLRRRA